MTSYQKLKRENARLRHELNAVCLYPKGSDAIEIIGRVMRDARIEDALWYGMPPHSGDVPPFDGLIPYVLKNGLK